MRTLKNEKELSSHGSLVVTNNRLVQEKVSFGKKSHKEIPLNKIDSISYEYSRNVGVIIIGAVLLFLGVLFETVLIYEYSFFLLSTVFRVLFIIGIIAIVLGFLLKKEFVEFSSTTLKIREEKRDVEKFVDVVREEISK